MSNLLISILALHVNFVIITKRDCHRLSNREIWSWSDCQVLCLISSDWNVLTNCVWFGLHQLTFGNWAHLFEVVIKESIPVWRNLMKWHQWIITHHWWFERVNRTWSQCLQALMGLSEHNVVLLNSVFFILALEAKLILVSIFDVQHSA